MSFPKDISGNCVSWDRDTGFPTSSEKYGVQIAVSPMGLTGISVREETGSVGVVTTAKSAVPFFSASIA